jgi:TolB protein
MEEYEERGWLRSILEWLGIIVVFAIILGIIGGSIYVLGRPYIQRWLGARVVVGNRIVYVGTDGNIYTVRPDGQQRTAITKDAEPGKRLYDFPTWAPDGRHLAFVGGERLGEDEVSFTLYVVPAVGGRRVRLYSSAESSPFYLYWAPDGQRLGFLTAGSQGEGLALRWAAADGKGPSRILARGGPLFWSWSPDGRRILLHAGGSRRENPEAKLTLLAVAEGEASRDLAEAPADFQAPAWASLGDRLLIAAWGAEGQGGLLARGVEDGSPLRRLAPLAENGAIAFVVSPKGDQVAYITAEPADGTVYGPLQVVSLDGGEPRRLVDDTVLGFFWSPNGERIAYFTLARVGQSEEESQVELVLSVVSVADGQTKALGTYLPTPDFINIMPYFDQYAQSATPWAPDSRHFVISQVDRDATQNIVVVDTLGEKEPRFIAEGTLAWWSWK